MTRKLLAVAAILGTGMASSIASAQLLSENFDDGSAASRWSAPVVESEAGVFDGTVDFAFDYSTLGVPAAPGGGGTTGLFMESNLTDDGGDQGETIGMTSLLATLPSGDYRLTMDVYYNVDNNAGGTTEFGIFGVHASGANSPSDEGVNDDVPFDFGLSNGDGLAWLATGDGGASNDFHRFEDAGNVDTGSQTGLGGYDDVPDGSIPGVPSGSNSFPKFGPEEQWVEITIESIGGIISWQMNGFELDSVDNTGGTYSGGTIMVGYGDQFNSVADGSLGTDPLPNQTHFILFDNINLVAVPEPGTAVLLLMGASSVLGLRRRRA